MDNIRMTADHERVWRELAAAVRNRRHGFHSFTLATVDADGFPQARTVILRGAFPEQKTIRFNADVRSPKIAELRANPNASAVFYGAEEKLQVRVCGTVTVHQNDSVTEAAWRDMQPMSREGYRTPHAPGSLRDDRQSGSETLLPLELAYHNLVLCNLTVATLEWLSLSSAGHERMRHDFADGVFFRLHP